MVTGMDGEGSLDPGPWTVRMNMTNRPRQESAPRRLQNRMGDREYSPGQVREPGDPGVAGGAAAAAAAPRSRGMDTGTHRHRLSTIENTRVQKLEAQSGNQDEPGR